MEIYLMELNLWNIVEAAAKPPTPKDGEIAFNAWSKKNSVALYLIRESCGLEAFPLIGKISMAKITWDTLAEKYKPKSTDSGNYLSHLSLWNINMHSKISLENATMQDNDK